MCRGFVQYAVIVFVTDYVTSALNILHFMTVSLQNEMRWWVTVPEILMFLVLNPIAPALNCVLWMIMRLVESEPMIDHYKFLSKLTCLINGTFESPVQIILTLFFYITGRIQPPWQDSKEYVDSLGNKINFGSYIPVLSFALGWISLIKNVADSYHCNAPGDAFTVIAFILPNVLLRIFSYFSIFLWVREYIALLILIIFLLNLCLAAQLNPNQSGINLSSSSFCSIFCVVGMPNDPSLKGDASRRMEVDPQTLKRLTFFIALVSIPILIGSCWLAYLLPASVGMLQDVNIQFTTDQEFFLMVGPYTGLIYLSIISCLSFWAVFNNEKVPGCIKASLNCLIIMYTISGIVLSYWYFPQSPTAVVLTVENNNGGIELFDGYTFSTGITGMKQECQKELGNGNLTCGNTTMATAFAASRKALSVDDQRLVLLAPQSGSENYEALSKGRIKIFPPQSEELQIHLRRETTTCLHCHHNGSNACMNILSASKKKHCTDTCSRTLKTFKPFKKEMIEAFLKTDANSLGDSWVWDSRVVRRFGDLQPIEVEIQCSAPKHFFGTSECGSRSPDCKLVQLRCVGNERWIFADPVFCRHCQKDDDCKKINLGKCLKPKGIKSCIPQRLLVGRVGSCEDPIQELALLDPITLKLDSCKLPDLPKEIGKASIRVLGNEPVALNEKGQSFKLQHSPMKGMQWGKTDKSMKDPREYAADIVLKDGRRILSGGRTKSRQILNSVEILGEEGKCPANKFENEMTNVF